jgi:hypothetical protein
VIENSSAALLDRSLVEAIAGAMPIWLSKELSMREGITAAGRKPNVRRRR